MEPMARPSQIQNININLDAAYLGQGVGPLSSEAPGASPQGPGPTDNSKEALKSLIIITSNENEFDKNEATSPDAQALMMQMSLYAGAEGNQHRQPNQDHMVDKSKNPDFKAKASNAEAQTRAQFLTDRSKVADVVQQKRYVLSNKRRESIQFGRENESELQGQKIEDSYVQGIHLVPVKETKEIVKKYVEQSKEGMEANAKREQRHQIHQRGSKTLNNKSIVSYEQYKNLLGGDGETDLEDKGTIVLSPAANQLFGVELNESIIQELENEGTNDPTLEVAALEKKTFDKADDEKQKEVKKWKDINVIRFDGYYGPFNKKTNLSTFRRKKTFLAAQNKEQSIPSVFGGLNAAAPQLKKLRAQERKFRNLSPHANVGAQLDPELKKAQFAFGQFQHRKSTIQHEPSIEMDNQIKNQMVDIKNLDLAHFHQSQHESRFKGPRPLRLDQFNCYLSTARTYQAGEQIIEEEEETTGTGTGTGRLPPAGRNKHDVQVGWQDIHGASRGHQIKDTRDQSSQHIMETENTLTNRIESGIVNLDIENTQVSGEPEGQQRIVHEEKELQSLRVLSQQQARVIQNQIEQQKKYLGRIGLKGKRPSVPTTGGIWIRGSNRPQHNVDLIHDTQSSIGSEWSSPQKLPQGTRFHKKAKAAPLPYGLVPESGPTKNGRREMLAVLGTPKKVNVKDAATGGDAAQIIHRVDHMQPAIIAADSGMTDQQNAEKLGHLNLACCPGQGEESRMIETQYALKEGSSSPMVPRQPPEVPQRLSKQLSPMSQGEGMRSSLSNAQQPANGRGGGSKEEQLQQMQIQMPLHVLSRIQNPHGQQHQTYSNIHNGPTSGQLSNAKLQDIIDKELQNNQNEQNESTTRDLQEVQTQQQSTIDNVLCSPTSAGGASLRRPSRLEMQSARSKGTGLAPYGGPPDTPHKSTMNTPDHVQSQLHLGPKMPFVSYVRSPPELQPATRVHKLPPKVKQYRNLQVQPKLFFASLPGNGGQTTQEIASRNLQMQQQRQIANASRIVQKIAQGGLRAEQAIERSLAEQTYKSRENAKNRQNKKLIIPRLKLNQDINMDQASDQRGNSDLRRDSNRESALTGERSSQRYHTSQGPHRERSSSQRRHLREASALGSMAGRKSPQFQNGSQKQMNTTLEQAVAKARTSTPREHNSGLRTSRSNGLEGPSLQQSTGGFTNFEISKISYVQKRHDLEQASFSFASSKFNPPEYLSCVKKEIDRNIQNGSRGTQDRTTHRRHAPSLSSPRSPPPRNEELEKLRPIQFPTKKHPILPQRERGIIRFRQEDDPPKYSLRLQGSSDGEEDPPWTHREKQDHLRNQKAKQQNLRDQHSWKLKTTTDRVQTAFNIKLDKDRQLLIQQFLREDQERRREFGDSDPQNIRPVSSSAFQGGRGPQAVPPSKQGQLAENFQQNQSNAFKTRLVQGISGAPNNEAPASGFLAPLKRALGGNKAGSPGVRFKQADERKLAPNHQELFEQSTDSKYRSSRPETTRNYFLGSVRHKTPRNSTTQRNSRLAKNTTDVTLTPIDKIKQQQREVLALSEQIQDAFYQNNARLIQNIEIFKQNSDLISQLKGQNVQIITAPGDPDPTGRKSGGRKSGEGYRISATQAEIMANYSRF